MYKTSLTTLTFNTIQTKGNMNKCKKWKKEKASLLLQLREIKAPATLLGNTVYEFMKAKQTNIQMGLRTVMMLIVVDSC